MADLVINNSQAGDASVTLVRGSNATRWKMLVSKGDFYLQNNYNSTNGYTNVISAVETSNPNNTLITIHGKLQVNNGIFLSNNAWTSYDTTDPNYLDGVEGRLYFKIIS